MRTSAILVLTLWANGACACGDAGVQLTPVENDAPRVELTYDDIPLAQPFSVEITICDDVDVEGLTVDAIMPAHQHGMNYTPTIVDLGTGVFRAEGMLFHMSGVWEFQVGLVQETGVIHYTQTTTLK